MSNEVGATPPRTLEAVQAFLCAQISRRTAVPGHEIVASTVLVEIGLQSIDAVLICGEVEDHFQIELDPAMMFEFRTMGEITSEVYKVIGAS